MLTAPLQPLSPAANDFPLETLLANFVAEAIQYKVTDEYPVRFGHLPAYAPIKTMSPADRKVLIPELILRIKHYNYCIEQDWHAPREKAGNVYIALLPILMRTNLD